MHYVVFLLSKGMKPYQQIVDINLPGSYLFEATAMRLFGTGALAWRLYDLFLLALIVKASIVILGDRRMFAGIVAGSIFAIIHIQDGIEQLGQRDLLIAALLLWSYGALFSAQRRPRRSILIFGSALLIGLTIIIKPVFLPLGLILLWSSAIHMRQSGVSVVKHLGYGFAGLSVPVILVLIWLYVEGSFQAFVSLSTSLIPFHAQLDRRSFSYLSAHILSPIAPLFAIWVTVVLMERSRFTIERVQLLLGIGCAFMAYIGQGKGFPYHRYPFLALLLIIMQLDFVAALGTIRLYRYLAAAALILECWALAPRSAWLSRSFTIDTPFQHSLRTDLNSLGAKVPGQVQCLDTIGGCINTLYELRVVQSTGYLYDCYLFTQKQNETTSHYRQSFWKAYESAHPEVLVVTDQLCFGDVGGFDKLRSWPELNNDIAMHYSLQTEWRSPTKVRWWSRSESPPAYRIYVRNAIN